PRIFTNGKSRRSARPIGRGSAWFFPKALRGASSGGTLGSRPLLFSQACIYFIYILPARPVMAYKRFTTPTAQATSHMGMPKPKVERSFYRNRQLREEISSLGRQL